MKARYFYYPRQQKVRTLTQIEHFQFSRVPEASGRKPEADRKLTGRLTRTFLFYCSSGSSRKGSGRRTGSVHGSCCFMWVPEGSRKVRKAYPEAHRKENNNLIFQNSRCQQSDFSQSGEDRNCFFCLWAVLENDLIQTFRSSAFP